MRYGRHALCFSLLLFGGMSASADPYKYTAVPDQTLVTIDEGKQGLVHYVLTNLGTEPFWVFTFGVNASVPIRPDPTDRAGAHYFGPDASLGVEVVPGGTFKFGYQLTTPKADRKPEHQGDPDFGLRTFVPRVDFQLRQGNKITTPFLPPHSGTVTAFDVKVVDAPVPEPKSILLMGSLLAGVVGIVMIRRRRERRIHI